MSRKKTSFYFEVNTRALPVLALLTWTVLVQKWSLKGWCPASIKWWVHVEGRQLSFQFSPQFAGALKGVWRESQYVPGHLQPVHRMTAAHSRSAWPSEYGGHSGGCHGQRRLRKGHKMKRLHLRNCRRWVESQWNPPGTCLCVSVCAWLCLCVYWVSFSWLFPHYDFKRQKNWCVSSANMKMWILRAADDIMIWLWQV